MNGASSRRKGHSYERENARLLSDATGSGFARVTDETQQGNNGDVVDKDGVVPIRVQCKDQKQPSVWAALREATEASDPSELPIAMIHRPYDAHIVALHRDDFLALIRELRSVPDDAWDYLSNEVFPGSNRRCRKK